MVTIKLLTWEKIQPYGDGGILHGQKDVRNL